jgi:hypothetical protein
MKVLRIRRGIVPAVCAALVAAGGVSVSLSPAGAATKTLHFYGVEQTSSITSSSGQVLGPNDAPSVGDVLDSSSLDYVGTHAHHASESTASDHINCVFLNSPTKESQSAHAKCSGQFAIGGHLILATGVLVSFEENGITPVTINGGTGPYKGAQGTVVSKGVGSSNNSDNTIELTR